MTNFKTNSLDIIYEPIFTETEKETSSQQNEESVISEDIAAHAEQTLPESREISSASLPTPVFVLPAVLLIAAAAVSLGFAFGGRKKDNK